MHTNPEQKSEFLEIKRLAEDCLATLKSWRIWLYMGMQDVRNQFRRSRMGTAWVLINLLLMSVSVGYIYSHLFHQDVSQFFPMLLIGLIIWNFISSIIVQGCLTFPMSEGYVKQFCFPKQLYILRFFVSTSINFFIGLIVYFVIAFIYLGLPKEGIEWIILGLILLFALNLGHLILTAYWGACFRDLSPALASLFQILFYITPIIFTAQMLEERGLAAVYKFNPLYYLIEVVRYPLLHGVSASPEIYHVIIIYGIIIWFFAILSMYKYDRKVAYWL